MFSFEGSGQRVIVGLGNDALSHPLPELSLGSPKLLPVLADHEGSLLLLFLLLVFGAYGFAHRCFQEMLPDTRVSWYVFISDEMSTHGTPKGNLICEAALIFQSC